MVDDLAVRRAIYQRFASDGSAPPRSEIVELIGDAAAADACLRRLHDRHMIVLDGGEVSMALPFAARPTEHRVVGASGAWWANCAWDSLAIPAALGVDARIEAAWMDTGEPVDLAVRDGELSHLDGHVHVTVPARHWWDDIVET